MPEYLEIFVNGRVIRIFINDTPRDERLVKAFFMDATDEEQAYIKKQPKAKLGAQEKRYRDGYCFKAHPSVRLYHRPTKAQTTAFESAAGHRSEDEYLPPKPNPGQKHVARNVWPSRFIDLATSKKRGSHGKGKSKAGSKETGNDKEGDWSTENLGLILEDSTSSPRHVHLRFSRLHSFDNERWFLNVHFGLHTVTIILTIEEWKLLLDIMKKDRPFKIAFAIEMEKEVVTFLSKDNLANFWWSQQHPMSNGIIKLPNEAVWRQRDIVSELYEFEQDFVLWDTIRRKGRTLRNGIAIHVLYNTSVTLENGEKLGMFSGCGKYNWKTIFFRAAIPVNITEDGLFESLSQVRRLIDTFREYIQSGLSSIMAFIEEVRVPRLEVPNRRAFKIAPTRDDRLRYHHSRVDVHRKKSQQVSQRQVVWSNDLAQTYQKVHQSGNEVPTSQTHLRRCIEQIGGIHQPFEPTHLKETLRSTDPLTRHVTGRGIFGKDWDYLQTLLPDHISVPEPQLETLFNHSPVMKYYYCDRGGPGPTYLEGAKYGNELILDGNELAFTGTLETTLYKLISSGGNKVAYIWTVFPLLPDWMQYPNSYPATTTRRFLLQSEDIRRKMIADWIIKYTKDFVVGPIEYSGIPKFVVGSDGREYFMIARGLFFSVSDGSRAPDTVTFVNPGEPLPKPASDGSLSDPAENDPWEPERDTGLRDEEMDDPIYPILKLDDGYGDRSNGAQPMQASSSTSIPESSTAATAGPSSEANIASFDYDEFTDYSSDVPTEGTSASSGYDDRTDYSTDEPTNNHNDSDVSMRTASIAGSSVDSEQESSASDDAMSVSGCSDFGNDNDPVEANSGPTATHDHNLGKRRRKMYRAQQRSDESAWSDIEGEADVEDNKLMLTARHQNKSKPRRIIRWKDGTEVTRKKHRSKNRGGKNRRSAAKKAELRRLIDEDALKRQFELVMGL